jgi:hypothetical protein
MIILQGYTYRHSSTFRKFDPYKCSLCAASQLIRKIKCCLIFIAGFCFIQNLHP